jgi:hypothetical protein
MRAAALLALICAAAPAAAQTPSVQPPAQLELTPAPVISPEQVEAARAAAAARRDALNDAGRDDMLLMQQSMERKGALETAISNRMREASESEDDTNQDLKEE